MLGRLIRPLAPLPFAMQARHATLIPRATAKAIREHLGKPKNVTSGYTLFYVDKFKSMTTEFPNFGILDIGRRLGSAWNSLSAVDKQKYMDRAAKLNEQTKIDMAAYKAKLTPRQKLARSVLFYNSKYSKGRIARREVPKPVKVFVKSLPAAPFTSGRSMFIASKLRGQKDATRLAGSVHAEWSKLSPQEKKSFEERATADQRAFMDNFRSYMKA